MDSTIDVTEVWGQTLAMLETDPDLTPSQRGFALLTSPKHLEDNVLTIATHDDFICTYVTSHLMPYITSALSAVTNSSMKLQVTVDPSLADMHSAESTDDLADSTFAHYRTTAPSLEEPSDESFSIPAPTNVVDVRDSVRPFVPTQDTSPDNNHRLNSKYTFDTFVIGSSNRFAHAAAVGVAEQPAKAYNPMFIYGDSGLGKTHLLHAIGHYTRTLYAGTRVRYVSSEEFTNDFINSIKSNKGESFKSRYRNVDVLLVDDIQYLAGKEGSQEEFFHTFNTLHNDNKQIVVTSDLPPKQLLNFEDRLRSRFEWGLITDIQPPDLETRIAILSKKAATESIQVDPQVLEFIASRISTNIRELEGALIRVSAFANLNGSPVTVPLAEMVLRDLLANQHGPTITTKVIMEQTADFFGISMEELCSKARTNPLVHARQISMYLCRDLTDDSLPTIGKHFGGRDHTTVMHAQKKITQEMAAKPDVYDQVTRLTSLIKNGM
ncbi:MAG: chromosomal replication initiator protein DnaA [Candidatus Nanopelagicales bacterium]